MTTKRVTVDGSQPRLDRYLSDVLGDVGRRKIRELIEQEKVTVDGRRAKSSQPLIAGQIIEITQLPSRLTPRVELAEEYFSQNHDFNVCFEDENLFVVNKPRAMHSVRQREGEEVTLADLVYASFSEIRVKSISDITRREEGEAGLVQRLDYFTSGLVMGAKRRDVWEEIHHDILSGKIEKSYLALVEGSLEEPKKSIELSLEECDGGRRMRASERGRATISEVQMIRELPTMKTSVVRITGRSFVRHQVRVHLASIGHPLVGDSVYGSERELPDNLSGFLLHAESIRSHHLPNGLLSIENSYFRELLAK